MRMQIKKTLFHKRTPEELEKSYRRMLAEREMKNRSEHWFSLRYGSPKN